MLQDKGSMPEKANSKSRDSISLIPANFLPDLDEKEINEPLNNQKYRPVKTTEESSKGTRKQQEENLEEDKDIKAKIINIVEIPDVDRKQKQFMPLDEYKRYKRALPLEGTIVTDMHVSFSEDVTNQTMREIISFFGFKIVAYPTRDPSYLLVCESPNFKFKKLDTKDKLQDFYNHNSNRTIEPEKGLLYWTKSELARQGMDAGNLKISIALGNSAGYFHWKEMSAIKFIAKPVKDINYTEARISKTPQGYWILLVEGISLKDGQFLEVEDQELKEILL